MKDIKISIIIPVYNEEPFIKRCINSLINQSYENIEIIFVDDGSRDAGKEIIEEYKRKDARIILYSKQHEGRYAAKNYGIDQATGEFLMLCDADDFLVRDAVKDCVNMVRKCSISDGVFFDYKVLDVNKRVYGEKKPPFLKEIPSEHVCKESRYLAFFRDARLCCIKKKIISDNNIRFKNIALYSDILFLAEFLTCSNVVNWIDKKNYVYYRKPAHVKACNVSKDCLNIFDVADKVKELYISSGIWENTQNLFYYEFLLQMTKFEDENLQYAKKDIQKAYKENLIAYINKVPYVYVAFISCYIERKMRVKVLSWHKDHSFELNLCERAYAKVEWNNRAKRAGRYIDRVCRCVLPGYRATTNLRTRMIVMQKQLDGILKEQKKMKKLLEENEKNENKL